MSSTQLLAACIMMAAQTHHVPPAVLAGIYQAERGTVGQEVSNTNGSHDLGPMQINTLWIPVLAKRWNVTEKEAYRKVRDEACVNTDVAAWILRQHLNETQNLGRALSYYHSRTPKHSKKYKNRVLDLMKSHGLLKTNP